MHGAWRASQRELTFRFALAAILSGWPLLAAAVSAALLRSFAKQVTRTLARARSMAQALKKGLSGPTPEAADETLVHFEALWKSVQRPPFASVRAVSSAYLDERPELRNVTEAATQMVA